MISNITLTLGTQANPYVLSANNLKTFNYIYQEAIAHSFNGYVTTKSGTISDYDLYVLQQLGFNVVYDEIETTAFIIYTLNEYIDEGTSIQIYNNTLEADKVNWRIADISITSTSLPASLFDTIKERIHITKDGVLVCDAPEENYSWLAEVTVEGSPNYNNSAIGSTTVYIRAVEVQDILVDVATKVLINSSNPLTVSKYPSTNTKIVGHFSITVSKGGYTNGVYYAPPTLGNVSLIVNYFLFSDSVPFKVINKTIEVTNPVITAQIVDTDGNSVDNGYIIISDGETETTILNGESAFVELGKTYNITVPNLDGYDGYTAPTKVTPTKAETIVKVQYRSLPNGVLIIFEDGSYVTYDQWDYSKTNADGSPAIAIGLKTEDVQFMISAMMTSFESKAYHSAGVLIAAIPATNDLATALTYTNGQQYTDMLCAIQDNNTTYAAPYCKSQILRINGVEKSGYFMTVLEGIRFSDNYQNINSAYSIISNGKDLPRAGVSLSIQTNDANGRWYLSSTSVTKHNAGKTTPNPIIPIFPL